MVTQPNLYSLILLALLTVRLISVVASAFFAAESILYLFVIFYVIAIVGIYKAYNLGYIFAIIVGLTDIGYTFAVMEPSGARFVGSLVVDAAILYLAYKKFFPSQSLSFKKKGLDLTPKKPPENKIKK